MVDIHSGGESPALPAPRARDRRWRAAGLPVAALLLVLAACGSPAPSNPPAAVTIDLAGDANSFELAVGEGTTLTVHVTDEAGNRINAGVTWSTSNASVATVSAGGTVSAIAAGSATITARTSNDISASVVVHVRDETAAPGLHLSAEGRLLDPAAVCGLVLVYGQVSQATLQVVALPAGSSITDIGWDTDPDGRLAVDAEGDEATILATAMGRTALTVNASVNGEPMTTTITVCYEVAQVVAAGQAHTLALLPDGSLYAWGWNGFGQLGLGSEVHHSEVPARVVTDNDDGIGDRIPVAISAGESHNLVLLDDGSVYAWGLNDQWQLGTGVGGNGYLPRAVLTDNDGGIGGRKVIAVAAGRRHSLAVLEDGSVYAWGQNDYGQLGNGSTGGGTGSSGPQAVVTDNSGGIGGRAAVAVSASEQHSLALLADGSVYAWGSNAYWQLGVGNSVTSSPVPMRVVTDNEGGIGDRRVEAVEAGYRHALALLEDGTVYSWGDGVYGRLGNGTEFGSSVPIRVVTDNPGGIGGRAVTAISASWTHSLALLEDGSVYAWGYGGNGELGHGGFSERLVPTPVGVGNDGGIGDRAAVSIAAGSYHSAAVLEDGSVYAWGQGNAGQLGNGYYSEEDGDHRHPLPVEALLP